MGEFSLESGQWWHQLWGNFLNQRGFLGVEFEIAAGEFHYAWVDLEATISQITIYAWGYETVAGDGILAGAGQEAIPGPATLFTLAMGAAGLYAWRRGRKRKSVKNAISNNEE